jgi:hypothetical protein
LYKNFKDFFKTFIKNHGIIESCPTSLLSGILGSPSISMMIEPDGSLELIGTYDKINLNYFKNILAISPQKSATTLVTDNFNIIFLIFNDKKFNLLSRTLKASLKKLETIYTN